MKLRANCKINIGLDVLRRRADGFHDVSTVMVPVRELYDRLEIEPAIETELVQLGLPVDCPPEDNICLRAWRLMHERYGAGPVRIVLDKRVPYGAGLGGGSADATAVVQGVDDCIIAKHGNVLLICKREAEQSIKNYVTDVEIEAGQDYI